METLKNEANKKCDCLYCSPIKLKYKRPMWWVIQSSLTRNYRETYLFKKHSEAKRFWNENLGGFEGDYSLKSCKMGKRAILKLARTDYEAEQIDNQLF